MSNVVVYSSSTCPYCTSVKDFLAENNIEYTERNISTDGEARQELMEKGHMGVPVTVIGDQEIVGFDQARLKEALGL